MADDCDVHVALSTWHALLQIPSRIAIVEVGGLVMRSLRKIMSVAVVGATGFANSAAVAQAPSDYPTKPVRLIIASGAGGAVTTIVRLLGSTLSEN
jgi:hypothetical protein